MNGGNHRVSGPSTYHFVIFGGAWAGRLAEETAFPTRGDTTIGNDVWTGWDSTILPGVTVGDGAIVGARAVVTRDVPPDTVVAGNPARIVRMRFEPDVITRLLRVRWWEWDAEKITRHVPAISGGDVIALEAAT
jgi:virginiamycin A acetyltransferase